jgi:glycosyltransferase involved in cell wall biosynthesis
MRILSILGAIGRLVVDPEQYPMSGIGHSALNIASAQAAKGHKVTLLGFSEPLPFGTGIWQNVKIAALRRWRWARWRQADLSLLLPMLWQVVLRFPADVLHIHMDPGLLYLPGAQVRLLHLHGVLPSLRNSSRLIMERADAVVCCSEYVRKAFLAICDYDPDRTFVVYNGAASDLFDNSAIMQTRYELGLTPEQIGVLFVGALVPEKGVDILLKALRKLDNSKFKAIIVGGSELWVERPGSREFERELKASACDLNITFTGLMPYKQVKRFYQACDIVVLPSIVQESHPLVVLEAMAAGKAVVASQVGGIPETVLNGETGILVPPGDADALATAISRLAEDQDLRERMNRAAWERAQLFTWEAAAEKLERIYQALLEGKGNL